MLRRDSSANRLSQGPEVSTHCWGRVKIPVYWVGAESDCRHYSVSPLCLASWPLVGFWKMKGICQGMGHSEEEEQHLARCASHTLFVPTPFEVHSQPWDPWKWLHLLLCCISSMPSHNAAHLPQAQPWPSSGNSAALGWSPLPAGAGFWVPQLPLCTLLISCPHFYK